MISRNFCQAHLQEVGLKQIPGDRDCFLIYFSSMTTFYDILQGKFHDKFQDIQTPPSNSLKLTKFETYNIKANPPLFFPPTKYAMVRQHDPFSLHTMLEGP